MESRGSLHLQSMKMSLYLAVQIALLWYPVEGYSQTNGNTRQKPAQSGVTMPDTIRVQSYLQSPPRASKSPGLTFKMPILRDKSNSKILVVKWDSSSQHYYKMPIKKADIVE